MRRIILLEENEIFGSIDIQEYIQADVIVKLDGFGLKVFKSRETQSGTNININDFGSLLFDGFVAKGSTIKLIKQ